jgi:hypothetical protein
MKSLRSSSAVRRGALVRDSEEDSCTTRTLLADNCVRRLFPTRGIQNVEVLPELFVVWLATLLRSGQTVKICECGSVVGHLCQLSVACGWLSHYRFAPRTVKVNEEPWSSFRSNFQESLLEHLKSMGILLCTRQHWFGSFQTLWHIRAHFIAARSSVHT